MTSLNCKIVYVFLMVFATLQLLVGSAWAVTLEESESSADKKVIGQTAVVEETESDFTFPARVDTGATTSSIHVEDWEIEDEAEKMSENVGKTIRFRIVNEKGKSEWLHRKIADISVIKTSEQQEERYKVRMTLNCHDVKKRVLVSLNDRSHMTYPVLLGRNFLQDDFVVDVDLGKDHPMEKSPEQPKTSQRSNMKSKSSKAKR